MLATLINLIVFFWLSFVSPLQIDQIHDVFLAAFVPQGRETEENLNRYFHSKVMPRLEKEELIRCAFDEGRIVGFAIFEKWEESTYYLAEMAVHPNYQNNGIGTQLVFSIFEKDPSATKIILMTEKRNLQAQVFYEAIGFHPSSFIHPDYPSFMGYEFEKSSEELWQQELAE